MTMDPNRLRAFTAELAKLLITQGFDVVTVVGRRGAKVEARLYQDGKQAGVSRFFDREAIEDANLAPMSIAIMEADVIRQMMPPPS